MNAPVNTIAIAAPVAGGRRQLFNARQQSLTTAKWRALWVLGVFVMVAAAALVRIAYLGLFDSGASAYAFNDQLVPSRGEMVDRNGVPLARMIDAYSLWYNPKALGNGSPLVKSPHEVALELRAIFPDLDLADTERRLRSGKSSYLRRRILPEEANRVNAIGEPALEAPRENERYYPQGSMAAHVLGFVSSDGRGRIGMEEVLQGKLTDRAERANATVLSIDSRVQGALEDELARGMHLSAAKGAAGIVLDVETGEVLALASLPSFDPNFIARDATPNIFNRATNQVYELGSTFKPITVAAALDAGTITSLAKRYPASPLHIGRFTIHDDENMGSSLNVVETLIHSSNIVSAQIGAELGGVRLKAKLAELGFNARPSIELPARGFPIWHSGEWPQLTTMTISFGHGLSVTPMHLASAYAALVNGGTWRPATLRKLDAGKAPTGRRVFTEATSAKMRQLLRMIALYGTGRNANKLAPGYRLGGKTGSAEKAGAGGGRYDKSAVIATFASAFPMDHPRYVVVATLDEPQKTEATSYQRTAAWNAAPVVGRLVPRIGPMLGVLPDETRDIDLSDLVPLIPGKAATE